MTLSTAWRWETLNDIADGGTFVDGDWVESKDQDAQGEVRLTQLADVGVAEFRDRSDRWMRPDQAERLRCKYLKPNDILIARMPEPLGRACMVPPNIGRAVTAVDVAILRIRRHDVEPRYIMWALNAPEAHQQVVAQQSGTTRKRISRRNLGTVRLPIPPTGEQRRIVAILEDHLSRLDAAATDVSGAARRLHVLEGAWLHHHLGRVTATCQKIPLGELASDSGYGTSTKCVVDGAGPPVVRIPNLIDGRVDLTDEKRVRDASVDVSGSMLRAGDLLFVRTNGSRDLIGRTAVVQEGIDAAFASYLIRYRVDKTRVLPGWVHLVMQAPSTRARLESMAASSAGQYNLSLGKLDQIDVPVPTIEEQERHIVDASDLHNQALRFRAGMSSTEHRLGALRRALLSAAFAGRLLPTSPRLQELASV